ncbi:DUF4097 family beta strand repeat-containing protein [Thermococcus paralvinellae]|uniref:DUF4097 domain-containing protein n=1 Tax=Thermococcus paralvinellae TaxID=582419 RepID=W0I625_9EURY|nr:DUF4097 family beta strand repeat-containing protein [Thermococcus paralvinellae]AHF80197.1 Hypothetical protein TES1_0811 [Thermococcus paralvinellae]
MIFESVEKIKVSIENGTITVEGWNEGYVEVEYTATDEAGIITKMEGNKLIIETPRRRFFKLFKNSPKGEVNVKINIPSDVPVQVVIANGSVNGRNALFELISSVNCDISLEGCRAKTLATVSGRIRASIKTADSLTVATVNGPIELTLEELEDNVTVSSVNGDIHIFLSEFCDAKIRANAVNGSIHIEDTHSINAGKYGVNVSTLNGSITIELI